ncbi:MAG: hypothetical protein M5U30_21310 [Burkholderiaceae bacterium]|nr:hypothetical protein [Burkholderiaceae bacterium]
MIACSTETSAGFTRAAMSASVSPERVVTSSVAPDAAAVDGVAVRAGLAAAVLGRALAAGLLAAGAGLADAAGTAAGVGATCALGVRVVATLGVTICCVAAPPPTVSRAPIRSSGGSSRKVYSRTNLPDAQFSSTIRSTKGSLIGCAEVIRTTAERSGRRSIENFNAVSAGLNSSPACRKASGAASRALSEPSSSSPSEVTSTSARNGWPSADWTVRRPEAGCVGGIGHRAREGRRDRHC